MSLPASPSSSSRPDAGWFAATHWSVVLAAKEGEAGKRELFERRQTFLVEGTGDKTFAEVALQVGMTEEAVKKAAQRMRRRYHRLFREEIAQTVASPAEVDEELRHLCAVLGS